ncbi:uncharacterized protein [Dysidea avara]|uniref:uncharacterized protein n=1 Tax=Dysidea avara TaxID=196820 RepID=UPI0033327183
MDQRGSSHSSAGKKQSHKAKSTSEWKKRLRRFAAGEKFRRGERPPKGSHWDDVISKIVACPAHQRDDRPYNCQYHPSLVPVMLVTKTDRDELQKLLQPLSQWSRVWQIFSLSGHLSYLYHYLLPLHPLYPLQFL